MKFAALPQASSLAVAEDLILKSAPAGFASAAVNRRRCSSPCSYVSPYRQVSLPLLCSWVSQIGISNLAHHFWGNATPKREVAVRGLPPPHLEHHRKSSCLKWFWGNCSLRVRVASPPKWDLGKCGGSPALDTEGCCGLLPPAARGRRRPATSAHGGKPSPPDSKPPREAHQLLLRHHSDRLPHIPASQLSNCTVSAGEKAFFPAQGRRCSHGTRAGCRICSAAAPETIMKSNPEVN